MATSELLAREAATAGTVLVVSGLMAFTLRRHLASNLLGAYLLILGGVVWCASRAAPTVDLNSAVILVSATTLTPVALAAFANWRSTGGSADQSSVVDPTEEPDGD